VAYGESGLAKRTNEVRATICPVPQSERLGPGVLNHTQTFPSVSFHRCRCVSDSEAVLGVWLPGPLPTPRALPDHGALWPLAVGVEEDLGGIDV